MEKTDVREKQPVSRTSLLTVRRTQFLSAPHAFSCSLLQGRLTMPAGTQRQYGSLRPVDRRQGVVLDDLEIIIGGHEQLIVDVQINLQANAHV